MSKCAGIMSCKCLRASPWKKAVKSLYPSQYSGYERDLQAQNAEELAKLALRNDKLFTPISNALVKNINHDLRKEKYGYVSIGISAFIALVDMCHDNLYRFESSVYSTLGVLFRVHDVGIRVDAMNLLIKLCEYKEQNDDSSNSKYFDFLDSILNDCSLELETFDETIILKKVCVDVLYQLILICPAALITTVLPKIIVVLVNIIYFTHDESYGNDSNISDLRTASIRCLSSIYPLVNVITSNSLLTPVFSRLDYYGWFTISFVRSILRPLTSTKNRDGFGKPGYLHILSHVISLLPVLSYDEDSKEEPTLYLANSNDIEMTDFTVTAQKLRLITNILLYVQTIFNESRINTFFHIQRTSEVLTSLIQFTLMLAIKNNVTFPLTHVSCEVEDIREYEDSAVNEELLHKCILQLYSVCEETLTSFSKSIVQNRDYFSFIEDLLFIIEESDADYKQQMLQSTIYIISTCQITSSVLIPNKIIQDFSLKLIEEDPDLRLLWIQFFTELFGLVKSDNSMMMLTSLQDTSFTSHLLRSMFMENNTDSHFQELHALFMCLLNMDMQNALPHLLPVLFSSQSHVVQKMIQLSPNSLLMQYLDSTTISYPLLSKLIQPNSTSSSQMFFLSTLDTVAEGEEEEEELTELNIQQIPDNYNEIPLNNDELIELTESLPPFPDEIFLADEREEESPYTVTKPTWLQYNVLSLNLSVLAEISSIINSDELKEYIVNIQSYHTNYHWSEQSEGSCDDKYDGKQAFYQKEAIVQFVVRSPLILSSSIPPDYTDKLRLPLSMEEYEETPEAYLSHGLHRLNSVGNSSELSFKNSVKDSDSEAGDRMLQHDISTQTNIVGSRYISENPLCSFEELMKRTKVEREGKEGKLCEPLEEQCVKELDRHSTPGSKNQSVTLMF